MSHMMAGVTANSGGQLLLLRALHFFTRRAGLLYSAAAVREADVNNPASGNLIRSTVAEHFPLGVHPLLLPAPGHEHLNLGQDPGNLGAGESKASSVKFRSGFTYVFDAPEMGAHVAVREVPTQRTVVEFAAEGRGDLESGLGSLVLDGVAEEVFIKEKLPELDGGGMPLLLRQVALEAATCATLEPLDCFVKIRAVQVSEDRLRMLFRRLPGRSFDEFLDQLEGRGRKASESQILGGALLTLGAYCKVNAAGYSQRDAKSENLWLSVSNNLLRVVITDSEACFKVGHIEDAHMDGIGNEVWQLRALRDRELWRFGGSTFSRAVSIFAANMDLQSKQCLPGEQAVVYSLTEIILRMMGEGARVWACSDDSRWEDAINASVSCDFFDSDDDDDGENPQKEAEAAAKVGGEPSKSSAPAAGAGAAAPPAASTYSAPFLHLVMTLRRRSFTQGGVDAFLDLGQALQLCRDFVAEHLHSTEVACLADFAGLVSEMASVAVASQPPHGATAATTDAALQAQGAERECEGGEAAGSGPPQRQWSELSTDEIALYHVCPVTGRVEGANGCAFEVVGLALRRKHVAKLGSDVELYMKSPHLLGDAPHPVCFASLAWWRRVPRIDELVQKCLRQRGLDLADVLLKALDSAWKHPLCVHRDLMCFHLAMHNEHFRGHEGMSGWPVVALYPYSEALRRSVEAALRAHAEPSAEAPEGGRAP